MSDNATIAADFKHETLKRRLALLRQKGLLQLEKYLIQFESAFQQSGGTLIWAETADEACVEIGKAVGKYGGDFQYQQDAKRLCEIDFTSYLEKTGLVTSLFPIETGQNSSATGIIADTHVLLADEGALWTLMPNDHMGYCWQQAEVKVLIAGIEQVLPALTDLQVFYDFIDFTNKWPTKAILEKPKHDNRIILVLVDNGRTDLLQTSGRSTLLRDIEQFWPFALHDNQELAKLKDAIWNKYLLNVRSAFLPDKVLLNGYALKGGWVDVPVKDMIMEELHEWAQKTGPDGDLVWRSWKSAALSRKFMNKSKIGPFSLMRAFLKRGWRKQREFPKSKKSFNETWLKERPQSKVSRKLIEVPQGQLLVRKPATDGLDD